MKTIKLKTKQETINDLREEIKNYVSNNSFNITYIINNSDRPFFIFGSDNKLNTIKHIRKDYVTTNDGTVTYQKSFFSVTVEEKDHIVCKETSSLDYPFVFKTIQEAAKHCFLRTSYAQYVKKEELEVLKKQLKQLAKDAEYAKSKM